MISRIPEETCLPDNDNFSAHDLLKKKNPTETEISKGNEKERKGRRRRKKKKETDGVFI